MNLNFDNNWRRALLLSSSVDYDTDTRAEYIVLDRSKLHTDLKKFCASNWEKYAFDYDTYSMLLWPLHDNIKADEIVDKINKRYPKCASVLKVAPTEAHNLNFNSSLDFTENNEYIK